MSKRNLYRPAPVETHELGFKRSLIQGRLTSESGNRQQLPEPVTSYDDYSDLKNVFTTNLLHDGEESTGVGSTTRPPTYKSPPTKNEGRLNNNNKTSLSREEEERTGTPRKIAPLKYRSPKTGPGTEGLYPPMEPCQSLEISEAESVSDIHHHSAAQSFGERSSSSGDRGDSSGGSLLIRQQQGHKMTSPQQASVNNNNRPTSTTIEGRVLPHVNDLPPTSVADHAMMTTAGAGGGNLKWNDFSGEGITDEMITEIIHSPVRVVRHLPASSANPSKMIPSNADARPENQVRVKKKRSGRIVPSRYMQSMPPPPPQPADASKISNNNNAAAKPKEKMVAPIESALSFHQRSEIQDTDQIRVKKKKSGQPVPSRYLQSMPPPQQVSVPKNNNAAGKPRKKMAAARPAPVQSGLEMSAFLDSLQNRTAVSNPPPDMTFRLMETPLTRGSEGRLASTPTETTEKNFWPEGQTFNESAISADLSVNFVASQCYFDGTGPRPQPPGQRDPGRRGVERPETDPNVNKHTGVPKRRKHPSDFTAQQLDLLYAKYIQALYLDMRAQKVMTDQDNEARCLIYSQWRENRRLSKLEQDYEIKLMKLRHSNKLDKQLLSQQTSLAPLAGKISSLKGQYKTLADALDTTRHQIPTGGVYVPPNEKQYTNDMISALNESTDLLGQISVYTRQKQGGVEACGTTMEALAKTVDLEREQSDKCRELLAACSTLTTEETSMKIRNIQKWECVSSASPDITGPGLFNESRMSEFTLPLS